jgi:hypothetical protein
VEADYSYVSDGSSGDEDDDVDVLLASSRTGLMRRGLWAPGQQQQQMAHRQWVRQDDAANGNQDGTAAAAAVPGESPEDLEALDPAERAARLQLIKARQEAQEKRDALLRESQQNAGRDPALFSKRTAFDIRFDQMEEKPWMRNVDPSNSTQHHDVSDYFNYGLTEETWLEYAEQQTIIRQELQDAARSKRLPNPNIVPVTPYSAATAGGNTTSTTAAAAAVDAAGNPTDDPTAAGTLTNPDSNATPTVANTAATTTEETAATVPLGPALPASLQTTGAATLARHKDKHAPAAASASGPAVPEGGAWGAGAVHLAELMAAQEQSPPPPPPPPPPQQGGSYGGGYAMDDGSASQAGSSSSYGRGGDDYRSRRGGRGRGGRGGGGRGSYQNQQQQGGGSDDYYGRKRPREDWRR